MTRRTSGAVIRAQLAALEVIASVVCSVDEAVGDLVRADILAGEETDGRAAGIGSGYRLRGVGLVRMRDVYPPEELTEFCRDTDACFGAVITAVPSDRLGAATMTRYRAGGRVWMMAGAASPSDRRSAREAARPVPAVNRDRLAADGTT